MMITTIKIEPAKGQREKILRILYDIQGSIRDQAGCLGCEVLVQPGRDKTIVYLDLWGTPEELRLHVRSDLYRHLLLAMELGARAPEIAIYEASPVGGLESIERLRTGPVREETVGRAHPPIPRIDQHEEDLS